MKNHLMAYASPYAQHKHTDSKNRSSRKRGAEEGPDTTCKLMGRLSISALLHLGSLALQKPLQPSNLQNNNLSTRDLNSQRWSSAGNLLQNEKIKLLLWFSKRCSHVGFSTVTCANSGSMCNTNDLTKVQPGRQRMYRCSQNQIRELPAITESDWAAVVTHRDELPGLLLSLTFFQDPLLQKGCFAALRCIQNGRHANPTPTLSF